MSKRLQRGVDWFHAKGWKARPFQKKVWRHLLKDEHGLLNSPTGSGKTLALFTPILLKEMDRLVDNKLIAIWITPLRSLAAEIQLATEGFARDQGIDIRVEIRNGDTSQYQRKKQRTKPPFMLVTTPESLHLLLSYKDSKSYFKHLRYIIVDEWHELLSSKRGVQTELAISAIYNLSPKLLVWGISATIGNLEQARDVILSSVGNGQIITSGEKKKIELKTILPEEFSELSWRGHYGTRMAKSIVKTLEQANTTLIFTNTRAQCEAWYQHLLEAAPDMAGLIALHHGSLSREIRNWVEEHLRNGYLKAAVCTSSLDLGVDFPAVDSVIQIGGAKGVARFIQRAGRSGHRPTEKSKIHFVPTHALEIIEGAAMRSAIREQSIEERIPLTLSYDVLAQFIITLALTQNYSLAEVKSIVLNTHAFGMLTEEEWNWTLDFVTDGSRSLKNYEEYKKVTLKDGKLHVPSRRHASRHRMHIGTIVSDNMMHVRYVKGGRIGTIEESFVSKLKPNDSFVFTGRMLEVVRIHDMDIHVKKSKAKKGLVVTYGGGRMPMSSRLGHHIREQLNSDNITGQPEGRYLRKLFDLQRERSMVPNNNQLLIESVQTREGHHLFVYPFEGKFVHEAMASILAFRISLLQPITFSMASNDYGFELLASEQWDPESILDNNLFSSIDLFRDLNASLNASEQATRKFRDIATIAGLVFQGFPGSQKKTRHMQASTKLLFSVFKDHEPDNLLYRQSFTETYEEAMEEERIRTCLDRISEMEICLVACNKPSPFAFPILGDRLRSSLSSEKFADRIKRMAKRYKA